MIKIADFCVGTGGFTLASQLANPDLFKTVFANDIDKNSSILYNKNFTNHEFVVDDIHNISIKDIPQFDILTAGFPCQSYSIAGNLLGLNDPRALVFWRLMEIVKYHKPRFIVFENVKNLYNHDKGNTFKIISTSITDAGYLFKYKILNTSKVSGIPQNRERIYIVCCRDKNDFDNLQMDYPEIKLLPISQILEEKVSDKYYYTSKSKIYTKLIEAVKLENTFYQYRRTYVRENKNGVCPTLTANSGTGGHNVCIIKDKYGIRKITPRECFRLQGFPDSYILNNNDSEKLSDSVLYKISGNAITVLVAKLIFMELSNIINNND